MQETDEQIEIGAIVTPQTIAGLWLADVPVNGDSSQKRNNVCVFKGKGKVLKIDKIVIDYDEWGDLYKNIGKLEYTDLLIECDSGIGWGGLGAVIKVSES